MTDLIEHVHRNFEEYYNSFAGLSEGYRKNFGIKRDHSFRVAKLCEKIVASLNEEKEEQSIAYILGLLHDIGRFKQLQEFGTFNDSKSVDHAELSVKVIRQNNFLNGLNDDLINRILVAIENHNKKEIQKSFKNDDLFYSKIIRDADKLDILQVLTDYYSNPKLTPNHTLTWEMPKGSSISSKVVEEIRKGKLVSKENIQNQMDIKIMQLSWVFDLNFRPSFEILINNHFLEKIFKTMPKNDIVIDIYRKVKVFAENKLLS